MSVERRGQAIRVMIDLVNRQREEPTGCGGGRQPSMDGTSRVTGDCHAPFCERLLLLRLQPRPAPRRSPASFAAIPLARLPGAKAPFAPLQQTTTGPWAARRVFPPALFPACSPACRILVRAH